MGVHLVIIVYLPANPKYRAFIERCIEFLEQVYKDEVLADLKLVVYSKYDPRDFDEVRKLGIARRFTHYEPAVRMAVIAGYHRLEAIKIFVAVTEMVTHHALWGPFNVARVVEALIKDIPRLKTIPRRVTSEDEADLRRYINELHTKYVVDNYFIRLNDKPVMMPWDGELLLDLVEALYGVVRIREILVGRRKKEDVMTTMFRVTYEEVVQMRNPLPNFREAIHTIFTEVIKRFPAEVYNSDPSRYGVLYMKQPIQGLPL
jgi:hypothetical protein